MALPLVLRIPKGSELSYAELDGNFTIISDAISVLQAKLAVPPTTSLSIAGPFEKGTTVNPLAIVGSITANDSTVISRSLKKAGVEIAQPVSNSFSFNDTSGINATTAYSLTTVFDTTTLVANATATFVAPSYFGVGTVGMTETQIKVLSKQVVNKANRQFTFSPTNQRYVLAYPASFGNLASVVDQNGFNVTSSFTKTTATFTLADGATTEAYFIYTSNDNTTQSGFKITFNF